MKEFRVRLFAIEEEKPKGLIDSLKKLFIAKPKIHHGKILNLKIGRPTEYDYKCVDVYYKDILLGEIRKKGIDELIEKGALVRASSYDDDRITITMLEWEEYQDKPEYKAWREKLGKWGE